MRNIVKKPKLRDPVIISRKMAYTNPDEELKFREVLMKIVSEGVGNYIGVFQPVSVEYLVKFIWSKTKGDRYHHIELSAHIKEQHTE